MRAVRRQDVPQHGKQIQRPGRIKCLHAKPPYQSYLLSNVGAARGDVSQDPLVVGVELCLVHGGLGGLWRNTLSP